MPAALELPVPSSFAGLPEPYFSTLVGNVRRVAAARSDAVADLARGNPEVPPPAHVIEAARAALLDPAGHGYPPFAGLPELTEAFCAHQRAVFGVDVDPAILLRGIKDVLGGGNLLMNDQEAQSILTNLQADLRKKQEEGIQQVAETNKKEGDAFLAANKVKDGVVALPSGLQYKILQEGTGPKPTAADTVTVNYRGTLINGTEFDSSYKRGQPASFPVGGIIKGWTEALLLMPVGSKWQLFIPADLAYGPRQAGPTIGPNSTLVFEVELLSIQAKPATPPTAQPAANPAPTATPPPAAKPTPKP